MPSNTRERPGKKFQFKEPLESELKSVYTALAKVDLGPFRFFYYDTDGKLYLQYMNVATGLWKSAMTIDQSGNIVLDGTATQSATIADPGNG
jgi:hypothetical protein